MKLAAALVAALCLALAGCSRGDEAAPAAADPGAAETRSGDPATADPGPPQIPSLSAMLGEAGKARPDRRGGQGPASLLGGLGLGLGGAGSGSPSMAATPGASAATPPATGDCAKVGAKLASLVKDEMTKQFDQVPPQQRAMLEAQLQAADSMLAELPAQISTLCSTQGWPAELTRCILQASSVSAIESCQQHMAGTAAAYQSWNNTAPTDTDGDKQYDVDVEEPLAPVGAPPRWDGKRKDCNAVAEHVLALALHQVSGMPADQQAMVKDMSGQVKAMLSQQCTASAWSESTRLCILRASSEASIDDCGAL